MNLEAAKLNETRASTWARLSMAACFATTSIMLVASLNLEPVATNGKAHASHQSEIPAP